MVLGAILALLGVWWYIPGSDANVLLTQYSTLTNYNSLIAMFQGGIGVLAVIIGIFIVWIEHDEIKIRRELQSEDFGRRVQNSVKAVAGGADEAEETGVDTAGSRKEAGDGEEEDADEFTCDACGRSFDSKRGLGVHKAQAH